MARFKKARKFARRAASVARRGGRRAYKAMSGDGLTGIAVGGAAYGALRGPVSDKIGAYVPKFAGEWTDEITMGVLSYVAMKKGTGIVRNIGKAGLTIESARIGAALTAGLLGNSTGTSTGGNIF